MSIAKNASRFDFLQDDADDPFQTGTKKSKKKSGSGSGDASKKKPAKAASNSDRKQLQTLAFGGGESKKKNKNANQNQQNGNCGTTAAVVSGSKVNCEGMEQVTEQKTPKSSGRSPRQRPKGISDEQWEEWQKRDADFVDEAYVSELQTALLQSKLEYETEQKNKPPGKGKKKKPVAVSLTDFNAKLQEAPSVSSNGMFNGNLNALAFGGLNYPVQQSYESDEDLVEKYRMEAKLEIERERQKALERQLLMSRQPPPPMARPTSVSSASAASPASPVDEKDVIINTLRDENLHLKNDVETLRGKVKTINAYLQAAHEVKDKAKLIYEVETLTKANNDLNEEVRQLHSQLEQEKSRSSAAMSELRRLLENRRRTTTEGSTS